MFVLSLIGTVVIKIAYGNKEGKLNAGKNNYS